MLVCESSRLVTTRLPDLRDAGRGASAVFLAAVEVPTGAIPEVSPAAARPSPTPALARAQAPRSTATATAPALPIDTASDAESDAAGGGGDRVADGRWWLSVLGRPTLRVSPVGRDQDDGSGPTRLDVSARLSPRMRDLLVFLALHPHGVRRDAVVAALWPETGRRRPANNLAALMARLRAAVAEHSSRSGAGAVDVVSADGEVYQLDPDLVRVDWWEFLAATHADWATGGQPDSARASTGASPALDEGTVTALHTAHELYRGPLADGMGTEWVLSLREAARLMVCVKPEPEFRSITDSWPLSWDTRRV